MENVALTEVEKEAKDTKIKMQYHKNKWHGNNKNKTLTINRIQNTTEQTYFGTTQISLKIDVVSSYREMDSDIEVNIKTYIPLSFWSAICVNNIFINVDCEILLEL